MLTTNLLLARRANYLGKLFIDVDISKKRGVGGMILHVKGDPDEGIRFKRSDIEPIMFISKMLTSAETRYGPTELEMAGVVWIIKKVQHLIEASRKPPTIIFTDHSALAAIAKQTSLTKSNTDKLNLRLVRASQYLSALPTDIRVKPGKFHIIPDALSRLFSIMDKDKAHHASGYQPNDQACDRVSLVLDDLARPRTTRSEYAPEYPAARPDDV
jgi:hypothetical protein